MSDLATLRTRLKSEANIQASEEIADATLDTWLADAIAKHSPQFTVDDLPSTEDEAVVVLAWITLCYLRASKQVNEPSLSGSNGYGADRDSPYNKNMNMAKTLQSRYDSIVADIGSDDPGSVIRQGKLVVANPQINAVITGNPPIVRLSLTKSDVTAVEAVLSWTMPWQQDFCDYYLYVCPVTSVRAQWNVELDEQGNAQLNPQAELVSKISDQMIKSVKVEDLIPNTDYFFMITMRNRRGTLYYSNEVFVHTLT